MTSNTDRLIEIIEDHHSYELAMRIVLQAAETHKLPPEGLLPTFNDSLASDTLEALLEHITGDKYDK